MSFAASALRRSAKDVPKLSRGLKATSAARSGGHGHGYGDPGEAYIHREHMYEVHKIRNKKVKWGLTAIGFLVGGFGLPWVAVEWQQHKAAG